MKSIKQIAEEIGVSKTAVRKRLTAEVKTKFTETVSGVIYISHEGEALIKQGFQRTASQTKFAEGSANKFPQVSGEVSALIDMIQNELDMKNKLINEQHQTIRELTTALENTTASLNAAQALHAGTIKKQLTDSLTESVELEALPKGFLARIFGRKKQ